MHLCTLCVEVEISDVWFWLLLRYVVLSPLYLPSVIDLSCSKSRFPASGINDLLTLKNRKMCLK